MLKIGLTGGIGSGKTVVADIFKMLGTPVFNADAAAKSIMENDPALVMGIKQLFGEESYSGTRLNRTFISHIVFNNSKKLAQLNALVHPATIAFANQWMEMQTAPYIVKEAALLFEAQANVHLDYVVGVQAPLHLRLQRAMARDSISSYDVMARIRKQMDEDAKMKLCSFVVVNDEARFVIPQVITLHHKFLEINKADSKIQM